MKTAAEKKKIKIEKKDTIEDEIEEIEKYINYDKIVSKKEISNKIKSNNDEHRVKGKNTSINQSKNLNKNKREKESKKYVKKEKKNESINIIMDENKKKKEMKAKKLFLVKKLEEKKVQKKLLRIIKIIIKIKEEKVMTVF